MNPSDHLSWPFFETYHRDLSGSLSAWALENKALLESGESDVERTTRSLAASLGTAGWLRYLVPADWGGALPAIDVRSLCLIRETLAFHSGIADCAFAIQGLGSAPVTLFGTDDLKKKYLPGVVGGTRLGAFALSEPESGSDVAGMQTTARPDGSDYVLDGAKSWISNAGIADHYIVFARTGEPGDAKGLAAFVVDAGTRGLEITERPEIIAPHVIGTVALRNCRVSASSMLGEPGDGFKIAMSTLDIFRATVGAAALGFARRALHEAVSRVRERVVFGRKLAQFQATQMRLADMAVDIDASALLVYRAAWAKDTQSHRVTL
ncbi:MAG TPA: acyl-CoA dehydrogenase family protein, partial [Burkholderiales bacterium]|nr:acyl-CoA dehydrogenase family protein [Burkholderiales bacterium]